MPQEVYENSANYTIEWDSDLEAIIHTWTDFTSGEKFREGASALLDAIQEKNASKLLVDARNVQAHDDEDKQWLKDVWTPKIVDAGVEYSAQLHRDSVVSKMDMQGLIDEMDDVPYNAYVTSSEEEGRNWLADK